MIPTPGYCTEVIRIYLARGLRRGRQHLDPGEFLSVEAVDFAQAEEMALSGQLPDGKTQLGHSGPGGPNAAGKGKRV